jgi:hypothetical protein
MLPDYDPAAVSPLAEYLCDEMQARGWTTDDAGSRMGGDISLNILMVSLIISVQDDRLIIDDKTFDGLATAFDVDPDLFRNLDAAWRRHPDRRTSFTPPESVFGPITRASVPDTNSWKR